jgi:hypothetical protein
VRGGGGGHFVKGGKQINLQWADDVGLALTEVERSASVRSCRDACIAI